MPAPTDPLLASARREALFTALVTLGALAYSVGYCTWFAYPDSAAPVPTSWGVPNWFWWGIVAPWIVCLVVTVGFALWGMRDEPLETGEAVDDHDAALWEQSP